MAKRKPAPQFYADSDFQRELPISWNNHDLEDSKEFRTDFWRDYARLIHSPAFRRLKGKTQLFPSVESDFFRCRLTHSLEVAEIGKSITNLLNYYIKKNYAEKNYLLNSNNFIDTDLIEMACLAHDIGHPPFGHQGEEALNECMAKNGGFEGNAQTLRILSKLEKKQNLGVADEDYTGFDTNGIDLRKGLNLTYRSLASILKYDSEIPYSNENPKIVIKGYYSEERELVEKIKIALNFDGNVEMKTIECQIMDIADDIAYSVYDLEDSLKGSFIRPIDLFTNQNSLRVFENIAEKLNSRRENKFNGLQVYDIVFSIFFSEEDRDQYIIKDNKIYFSTVLCGQLNDLNTQSYIRSKFCSNLVTKYIYKCITSIKFDEINPRFSKIIFDQKIIDEIEVLKKLTYTYQIDSPKLKIVESNGKNIIIQLFKKLNSTDGYKFLPEDIYRIIKKLKASNKDNLIPRVICDFIAGMTNSFAIEYYNRLFSADGITIHKPIS